NGIPDLGISVEIHPVGLDRVQALEPLPELWVEPGKGIQAGQAAYPLLRQGGAVHLQVAGFTVEQEGRIADLTVKVPGRPVPLGELCGQGEEQKIANGQTQQEPEGVGVGHPLPGAVVPGNAPRAAEQGREGPEQVGVIVEDLEEEFPEEIPQAQFLGAVDLGAARAIPVTAVQGVVAVQTAGPPVLHGKTPPFHWDIAGFHRCVRIFGQIVSVAYCGGIGGTYAYYAVVLVTKTPVIYQNKIVVLRKMEVSADKIRFNVPIFTFHHEPVVIEALLDQK